MAGCATSSSWTSGWCARPCTSATSCLTRLAPHLVKPVSFLYPLTRYGWERVYVGSGLVLYDALGGSRALPRHRHLTRRGARALAPALRHDALVGGIRYYDALV